jgi:hypothetical protein
MGKLADIAKSMSKFISLSYGESVEAVYTGEWTKAKLNFGGNSTEGIEFEFETDFGKKTWFTGNGSIINQFDTYKEGDKLVISRGEEGSRPMWSVRRSDEPNF